MVAICYLWHSIHMTEDDVWREGRSGYVCHDVCRSIIDARVPYMTIIVAISTLPDAVASGNFVS